MIEVVRRATKEDLKEHLYNIDLQDKNLYEEVNKSTFGIFQFSGDLASKMIKQVQPENFEELMVVNACARPGTSSFLPDYINNKYGDCNRYPDKISSILKPTRGLAIYQENVMQVFNKIGGFTLEETNYVRGLMKKLGKAKKAQSDIDAWNECLKKFIKGAMDNGIKEKDAKFVADDLLKLSSYSFNRSHAYAYTYNAIETIYLATYFKQYFYAATLAYENEKKKLFKEAIVQARQAGYHILPPDVNTSVENYLPLSDGNILWGLMQIKGISGTSIQQIISKRPYSSVWDFISKHNGDRCITKRVVEALIYSGAFDTIINKERTYWGAIVSSYYEKKKTTKVIELLEKKFNEVLESTRMEDYRTTNNDFIKYDEEYLDGNFFHSCFSDELKKKVKRTPAESFQKLSMCEIKCAMVPLKLKLARLHKDKNGNEMAFMEAEDMNGLKVNFPIFASYWQHIKDKWVGDGFYFCLMYEEASGEYKFGTEKWTNDNQKSRMLVRIEE